MEKLELKKLKPACLEEDDDCEPIELLPEKKRGRPLLLGDEMDQQVKAYLVHLRAMGAPVNLY